MRKKRTPSASEDVNATAELRRPEPDVAALQQTVCLSSPTPAAETLLAASFHARVFVALWPQLFTSSPPPPSRAPPEPPSHVVAPPVHCGVCLRQVAQQQQQIKALTDRLAVSGSRREEALLRLKAERHAHSRTKLLGTQEAAIAQRRLDALTEQVCLRCKLA